MFKIIPLALLVASCTSAVSYDRSECKPYTYAYNLAKEHYIDDVCSGPYQKYRARFEVNGNWLFKECDCELDR